MRRKYRQQGRNIERNWVVKTATCGQSWSSLFFSQERILENRKLPSSGNRTTSKYTGLSCPHTSLIKTTSAHPFLRAEGSPSCGSLSSQGGCRRKGVGSPLGRDQHHLVLLPWLAARALQKQTQRGEPLPYSARKGTTLGPQGRRHREAWATLGKTCVLRFLQIVRFLCLWDFFVACSVPASRSISGSAGAGRGTGNKWMLTHIKSASTYLKVCCWCSTYAIYIIFIQLSPQLQNYSWICKTLHKWHV